MQMAESLNCQNTDTLPAKGADCPMAPAHVVRRHSHSNVQCAGLLTHRQIADARQGRIFAHGARRCVGASRPTCALRRRHHEPLQGRRHPLLGVGGSKVWSFRTETEREGVFSRPRFTEFHGGQDAGEANIYPGS